MKLHTKWRRVYNPIIGVRFFDGGDSGLGFFTIEKLCNARNIARVHNDITAKNGLVGFG
jgi:hypothetical protein